MPENAHLSFPKQPWKTCVKLHCLQFVYIFLCKCKYCSVTAFPLCEWIFSFGWWKQLLRLKPQL